MEFRSAHSGMGLQGIITKNQQYSP